MFSKCGFSSHCQTPLLSGHVPATRQPHVHPQLLTHDSSITLILGNLKLPQYRHPLPSLALVAALILVEERNWGEFLCIIWFFALQWLKRKDPAPALSRAPANTGNDPRSFPL